MIGIINQGTFIKRMHLQLNNTTLLVNWGHPIQCLLKFIKAYFQLYPCVFVRPITMMGCWPYLILAKGLHLEYKICHIVPRKEALTPCSRLNAGVRHPHSLPNCPASLSTAMTRSHTSLSKDMYLTVSYSYF